MADIKFSNPTSRQKNQVGFRFCWHRRPVVKEFDFGGRKHWAAFTMEGQVLENLQDVTFEKPQMKTFL